jgi:putative nucleotidyltransferase with HDIG domain
LNAIRVYSPLRANVLTLYIGGLALAAVGAASGLLAFDAELGSPWGIAALAAAAALAERGSVRIDSKIEESISLLPTVFAAVLFGPLAAMAVGAASMLGDFRPPYLKWAAYTGSRAITGCAAGVAAVGGASLIPDAFGSIAMAAICAGVVAELLDMGFAAVILKIKGLGAAVPFIRTHATIAFASGALFTAVVALLAAAYQEISPWTLPLFLAPGLAAHRFFILYQEQKRLAGDLLAVNGKLESANLSFATALVATLDARDEYTAGHSAAVAIFARDIACRMGLSEEDRQLVHLAGLVHDIGKIGLPPGLLEKSGPLTLDERRQMEAHSEIGERILAKVDDYAEIASIVRHHHERVDGRGYPDGLAGEEIPLLSRIIAVADAYNAMTSDRPYRDAMPSRVARLRLAQAVESQFDTTVVAAFEAVLAAAGEEYKLARGEEFAFFAQARQTPRSLVTAAA